QLGERHYPSHRAPARAALQAVGAGIEIHVLPTIHVGVGGEIVRHEPDEPPYAVRIVHYRIAMDGRFTISRHVDRRQDAHRGGLGGAVGPDKAEYLTGVETERHAIDGLERPKMTMQLGYFHHTAAARMELCLSTFPSSHRGFR